MKFKKGQKAWNKGIPAPYNLITLCVNCHAKTNIHRDYWIDYFKKVGGI